MFLGESKAYIMNHKDNFKYLNLNPDTRSASDISSHMEQCSPYLIARNDSGSVSKELLYQILSPVFFGQKQASTLSELADLFLQKYGIDVNGDFFEGDEHYEEYQEACQAIRDGMSIYEGTISFDNCMLAELAEAVWTNMEEAEKGNFRRINTLLEE